MAVDARGAGTVVVGPPDQAGGLPFVGTHEPVPAPPGQAPGMARPLEVADLADLALPGEPSIAADGRTVVYVLRTTDTTADADHRALWAQQPTLRPFPPGDV